MLGLAFTSPLMTERGEGLVAGLPALGLGLATGVAEALGAALTPG